MQAGLGDVSFTVAELVLMGIILSPLIATISWLAKRLIDDKDRENRELKMLLKLNTSTTEHSVETTRRSLNFTEEQIAQFNEIMAALAQQKVRDG